MINYEQIKQMMGNFNPPIQSESHEIPPVKNQKDLYVSRRDKKSLKELRARLKDTSNYSSILVITKVVNSGQILRKNKIMGHFDHSKIVCGDCSKVIKHEKEGYNEHVEYRMIMVTPNGAVLPTALTCPKCNVNYMNEIERI